MVFAIIDNSLEVDNLGAGERADKARLADALFNGGNVVLRDVAADDFVREGEVFAAFFGRIGLETEVDFGELAVTNLVVEVAEGETYACDPAPGAYFVEGSWTFTAERTSGGPMPAGCRVQDWDPVNERWTNPRGSESLVYVYDAATATAPKQRLVWRSLRPFLFIVR